jgi:hypothetical protein
MIPDDRWPLVKALFAAAVDRPVEERASFLDGACVDDAPLRQEVDALLAADAQAGNFIETPALILSTTRIPGVISAATNAPSLRAGECLGPYELVEFIGAGGMGEVY